MDNDTNQLKVEREFRELDHMDRWQIIRVQRKQSVASHTWLVASYALRIAQMLEWKGDYSALMQESLWHDLDETITGDLPRTYKWAVNKVPGAKAGVDEIRDGLMKERFPWWDKIEDPEARMIVYLADILESVLYLYEEAGLGNSNAADPVLLDDIRDQLFNAAGEFDDYFRTVRDTLKGQVSEGRIWPDAPEPPAGWFPGWATTFVTNSIADEQSRFSHIITQPK